MNILLYIDGDNFSFKNFERLVLNIKIENPDANIITKVFGEFCSSLLDKWDKVSTKYGATIHHIPKIKNKNVTDHFIIVAAMEDLINIHYEVFALASDDVDFIALFLALKKKNKKIWQISQNIEKTKNMDFLIDKRIPILDIKEQFNAYSIDDLIVFVNSAFDILQINNKAKLGDVKTWIDKNIEEFSMNKTKHGKFSNLVNSLNLYTLDTEGSEVYMTKNL